MTDRCPMSDLPPDQCALPCHRNETLPDGVDSEAVRGVEPAGRVTRLTAASDDQHEPRDTRHRPRRPKPLESCRWNGGLGEWVTPEHVRACDDRACRGCKPCGRTHCAMRGSCPNHVDPKAGVRTCAQCVGGFRVDVLEVATLATLVDEELAHVDAVEHSVTGKDAPIWTLRDVTDVATLAGPVASPENLVARRRADRLRGWCDYPRRVDAADTTHPAAVLGRWELLFRTVYQQPPTQPPSVATSAAYLTGSLLEGHMPHGDHFEACARDVAAVRAHLEDVLSDSRRPELGAPCPTCAVELQLERSEKKPPRLEKRHGHWCDRDDCTREHDKTGASDRWVCPQGHTFTEAEYRLRIGSEYLARADKLTAADMATQYGIKASTLRTWADRGLVHRRGKDPYGRLLYDVADARRAHRDEEEETTA